MVKVDNKSTFTSTLRKRNTSSSSTTTMMMMNTPERIRNAWKKIKLRKPKRVILKLSTTTTTSSSSEEDSVVVKELKDCTVVIKTFTKLKEMQSFINQLSSERSGSNRFNTLTVIFVYNSDSDCEMMMRWFKYCYFYLLEKKLSSFSFPMILVDGQVELQEVSDGVLESFVYDYKRVYDELLLEGLYIWNGPLIDSTTSSGEKVVVVVVGNVLVSTNTNTTTINIEDPSFQDCVDVFYTTSKNGGFKVMEIVKNITQREERELFKEYMRVEGGVTWSVEFRGELGFSLDEESEMLLLLGRLRVPLVKSEVEVEEEVEEKEEVEDVLYFLLESRKEEECDGKILFDMKLLKLQNSHKNNNSSTSTSSSPYDLLCGLSSGVLARVPATDETSNQDMESMLREYTDATEQNIKEILNYYKEEEDEEEEFKELFSEKEVEQEKPAGLVGNEIENVNVKEEVENVFMMEETKVAAAVTKPKRISNLKLAKMRRQKALKD